MHIGIKNGKIINEEAWVKNPNPSSNTLRRGDYDRTRSKNFIKLVYDGRKSEFELLVVHIVYFPTHKTESRKTTDVKESHFIALRVSPMLI